MTLLIGIDEAGYGPNLGPLCIGATAWLAPSAKTSAPPIDLYQLLTNIITLKPDGERIAIADSKQLYKPASHSKNNGLRHLERGVLTAMAALGKTTSDWRALLTPPELPWYADFNCPLPIDATATELSELAERFLATCETASVRLVDMRNRLVFPQEFNELTEKYGTKGAALSHVSIELLKAILPSLPLATCDSQLTTRTSITCDKHGGRNRYAALLQHHFPDQRITTVVESRPASIYRWGPPEAQTEICFRTKGEAVLPVALASMTAKYHRELAMRAFNAFWKKHLPSINPTAGYPQDAKRFKAEINTLQSKLEIDDHILWRNR